MRVRSRGVVVLASVMFVLAASPLWAQSSGSRKGSSDSDRAASGDNDKEDAPEGRPEKPPEGFGPGGGGRDAGHGGAYKQRRQDELAAIKKDNPELYRLIMKERALARRITTIAKKYRSASTEQQAKLKEQIRKVVTEHFEVGQKRREVELKYREKTKQEIIEQRVSRATSQGHDGHGGPPGMGGRGEDEGDDNGMRPMGPPPGGKPPREE